ncbi:MAG TPA: N-acetyl-gamma-glutamyl-phosphate reductase [Candidatus Saccharimonadales bacterium]|nr:N-acetyl-gamma-glutamyl-phosphate reductase [Candidatus Saccharimonadales bacterium]
MKKKVGIIGASGYTGHELLKILEGHPQASVDVLNSRSFAGQKVSSLYKDFAGNQSYTGYSYDEINELGLDLIFLALPHGLSMEAVKQIDPKTRIIDLSADHRFKDPKLYQQVYGKKMQNTGLKWVYGLPELFASSIRTATYVANPGCYATGSILATYPVRELASRVIMDCKSGWSGAGRNSAYAKDPSLIKDDLVAYNIVRHRHKYEIRQFIKPELSFTPHVFDTFQGMICTAHIILNKDIDTNEIKKLYEDFYDNAPFVRVLDDIPKVSDTRQTNFCNIGGFEIDETGQLVVIASLDNLLKGASGQAVQNMNLMLGLPETAGLAS